MNYNQMIDYLYNIPKFSKKNGLDNIKRLLDRMGNKEKQLKYIHVAGTNGKGSVCAFLSSILVEQGMKVGMFTSPHLLHINERIRINGENIDDQILLQCFLTVKKHCDELVKNGFSHPIFFEVMFAIAIEYFSKQELDIIILETGLGGRLDATNIINNPLVSVITSISLDHTNILGNTLELITKEKAGIIKPRIPVVFMGQSQNVDSIIQDIANKNMSELYYLDKINYKILNISNKGIDFSLNTRYYNYNRIQIKTVALYQIINCAIALTVIEVLKKKSIAFHLEDVITGIKKTKWHGRMEFIKNNLLIDGAHNVSGVTQFVHSIKLFAPNKKIYLIFGCVDDKHYSSMIKYLCSKLNILVVIITEPQITRAVSSKKLLDVFKKYYKGNIIIKKNIKQALMAANELASSNDLICCLGSLYLIGNIYQILREGTDD